MFNATCTLVIAGFLHLAAAAVPNDLATAIERNDAGLLARALKTTPELANQSLGERFGRCDLPLGICVQRGYVEFCRQLVNAGARIDAVDSNQMTPLMIAASTGQQEIAALLLERGANVNLTNERNIHGQTALDFAAKNGHGGAVDLLLDRGADPALGRALPYALYGDHFTVAEKLLDRGADPNDDDAMFVAAERAPLSLLQKMVARGGDINAQQFYGNVLGRATGSLEKTEFLIRQGADVNASFQNGHRAIHNAALSGNVDVLKLLVDNGSDVDVRKADAQRPLDAALWRGHLPAVQYLIEAGADPDVHALVAMKQNDRLVEWLAAAPGDLERPIAASNGTRPLHTAIVFRNTEAIDILLAAGADPNAAVHDMSALHVAVSMDNVAAADRLLKRGANVRARLMPHRYGTGLRTPLHLAVSGLLDSVPLRVNLEMVELLLRHGADPDAADEMRQTPKDAARRHGDPRLVELLGK